MAGCSVPSAVAAGERKGSVATGQLFYDADGSGGAAAVQFATLAPGLNVTAGDFMVI